MKKKILLAGVIFCLSVCSVNAQNARDCKSFYCPNRETIIKNDSLKPIKDLVGNYDNEVKVIFSDIDSTIVPLGNKAMQPKTPESAVLAADKLKKSGVNLILTTGRAPNEIDEIANALGSDNTYFILLQGAAIMDPDKKIIYEDYINKKDAKKIIKSFEAFKKKKGLNSEFYCVINGEQYSNKPFVLPYNGRSVKVFKNLDELGKNVAVSKFGIYEPDVRKNKLIQDYLTKSFPNLIIYVSGSGYCDISSATATKGNAIKILSEKLGIDLKNAAVFGDAENDLTMFKVVKSSGGLTIAVKNAMLILKQNADYVTSSVYEGGFAKGVDEITKNNALLETCVKK